MFLGLITRCLNEPYVGEFVNHYLNEGVDKIYIIDDNSREETYHQVKDHSQVEIVTDIPFRAGPELTQLYRRIKKKFDWILVVDVDEYVTTKKHQHKTIREELMTTFHDADCIKIPWVMMAFNGIKNNPKHLLNTNTYRWNHDKKHSYPNAKKKFRCRYEKIEIKCAFRTKAFQGVFDHHPLPIINRWVKFLMPQRENKLLQKTRVVDSIYNQPSMLDSFYPNLREKDIKQAYLLCFHYRVVSEEQCIEKLAVNHFPGYAQITLEDFINFDYPELQDNLLKQKSQQRPWLL